MIIVSVDDLLLNGINTARPKITFNSLYGVLEGTRGISKYVFPIQMLSSGYLVFKYPYSVLRETPQWYEYYDENLIHG